MLEIQRENLTIPIKVPINTLGINLSYGKGAMALFSIVKCLT